MEPAEIIASVNYENAGLQAKVQKMEQQLFEMHILNNTFKAIFQSQGFEICRAVETINGLCQHIQFLQSYIAHVEQQSEQGMLACQQTAEFFERENAAEQWSSHQWSQEAASLSTGTKDLQKAVLTKIESSQPSEEQTRQLMEKITEIESNILLKEIQNNDFKHTLQEKKNQFEEVRATTTVMIAARDDLNRKLARTNNNLRSKAGRNSRTLSVVKKEKDRLEEELANAEAVLAKHEQLRTQLHEVIQKEGRLQTEYQAAIDETENLRLSTDFYKREDFNQVKVITSLQREVAVLQDAERKSGYTKTINDQRVEIAQLVSNQARLEDELQKNKCIVTQSLSRLVEQINITKEAKKETAMNKGHALGTARSLLDSLSQTKTDLAKDIVDTVFTMLRDLDSKQKAREAIALILGYLSKQGNVIYSFAENVASNGGEVQDLITHLQG